MTSIQNDFQLTRVEDLANFFPDKKDDVKEKVVTNMKRVAHFVRTGIWIDAQTVCNWIGTHDNLAERKIITRVLENKPIQRKIQRYQHGIILKKTTLVEKIKDAVQFVREFIRSPNSVGSVLPSSDQLAKAIVRQIPKGEFSDDAKGRLILEVGPGTGAFTDRIIRKLGKNDILHLVEYDEQFCTTLREKYKHLPNVKVFYKSITDYTPDVKYDYIVSGLPLNAFEASFVEQVFKKYESIIKAGGKMSYFEYLFLPQVTQAISSEEKSNKLRQVLQVKDEHFRKNHFDSVRVWWNFTPAQIREHLYTKTAA